MTARSRLGDDRGVALVEMALIAPLLFFLAMGVLDFGRVLASGVAVKEAAQEGVGNAIWLPDDPGEVVARTVTAIDDVPLEVEDVEITCLADPPGFVAVRVTHNVELMTPFANAIFGDVALTAQASGEIITEDPCVEN